MSKYRLTFELVGPYKGSKFYSGSKPNCRPEDVPDEYWDKVDKEDNDPWQQYQKLKEWAETGEQLIRNVKLYAAPDQEWKEVSAQDTATKEESK